MNRFPLIIGIDPGSLNLGYGVVSAQADKVIYVTHGVLSKDKLEPNERLAYMRTQLDLILKEFKPDMASVEKVFLGKNPQSVFRLGLARGVALSCLALENIKIFEYSPTQMKKAITGTGNAMKPAVARSVKSLLGLKHDLEFDAADALGLAYMHARVYSTEIKMQNLSRV